MKPLRIIISDGHARRDSEPLIAHVARYLGAFDIAVEGVRVRRQPRLPYGEYAALIANAEFPFELRNQLECFGKTSTNMPSRPETLEWLSEAGLPMMRWSLAKDHLELDQLFDQWQTDAVLLKRSDTYGGTSVTLFTREHAAEIQWDPSRDLFCPEVNPDDGDIYKLEMFGRDDLLGWMSKAPPARTMMDGGRLNGIYGAYGQRKIFEWPEQILEPARRFGDFALGRGYGHISLDLMKNPDGKYEVIEVNLGNVAIWWTMQFSSFRRRYARAVHQMLIERHGASQLVAGFTTRLRYRLLGLLWQPKLLMREMQGERSRRQNMRELEARLDEVASTKQR